MNNRILVQSIKTELVEVCESEATRLYKLALTMEKHGVSAEKVQKCREEADELHMCSYPERVLDPFKQWDYAFRYEAKHTKYII